MAIGGDILIKLAADVAELRQGLDDARRALQQTGESVDKAGGTLTKFIAGLGIGAAAHRFVAYLNSLQKSAADLQTQAASLGLSTDQFQAYRAAALESGQSVDVMTAAIGKFNVAIGEAAQGSKAQIDALNSLGVKILDANGNLRSQGDLITEFAQKLLKLPEGAKRAAAEVAFFGKSGQELNPVLEKLAQSTDSLIDRYTKLGLIIDQDTIDKLDKLQTQSDIASQKIDVLFSKLFAEVKTGFLEQVATALKEVAEGLKAASAYEGILDKILAFFSAGSFNIGAAPHVSGKSAVTIWQEDLDKANQSLVDLRTQLSDVEKGASKNLGADILGIKPGADAAKVATEELQKQIAATEAQAIKLQTAIDDKTLPAINVTATRLKPPGGSSNPAIKGGGATPRDRVAEMLDELQRRQVSEEKALRTLREASVETPLRELDRAVELQRKIDEKIASVASKQKGGASSDLVAKITAQVTATETAAQKVKDYEESLRLALSTEKAFGDGTAQLRETMSQLNDALQTGRLSQEAYAAAVQQANEKQQEQAFMAERAKGGIDAFVGGWELAAQQFAKANDSFSQGGQLFNNVVDIMGQGLNEFATTGQIQFDKLLASFINMLSQMALRAAASQVFGALFGGATGGAGGGGLLGGLLGGLFGGGGGGISGETFATGSTNDLIPGVAYTVGEFGRETFIPRVAGQIMTADELSGGGGARVSQTINISTGVAQTVRAEVASMMPLIAEAGAQQARANRERGGRYKSSYTR